MQRPRFLALGRIGKSQRLRRYCRRSLIGSHRSLFLTAFLSRILDNHIGLVINLHIHLVDLLAYQELVMIACGYRNLIAFEVAYEVRERLRACINVEREGVFQTFIFLDNGCARRKGHSVGDDLHGRMLVAHWAYVATHVINILQYMPIAFHGQLYRIGEHLNIVEEWVLQLYADRRVFL